MSSCVEEKGDHVSSYFVDEDQGSCDDKFLEYSDEFDDDDEICSKKRRQVNSDDESRTVVEPLIRCAWSGDFDVHYDESMYHRRIYSFNAFVSSVACQKVFDAAKAFEQVLFFEMLPRSSLWPKPFRQSGSPNEYDIALYFFPPLPMHEALYNALVYEMISEDLAMRASVQNAELLIFASDQLPPRCGRFQGKFYLWGVFKSST